MLRRLREYCRFVRTLFATNIRLLWGMWKLTKLPQPAITIFGGNCIKKDSVYAKRAYEIARRLTLAGYSIITGGGKGIMQAANQGAYDAAKEMGLSNGGKNLPMTSFGITLTSFQEEALNPYVHEKIYMKHFFSRKWFLVRYSIGFIVFPGGFGTMDELFEIVTLEQTCKMSKLPIILMDNRFWEPVVDWIKSRPVKQGLIKQKDLNIVTVTSDVSEAFNIIEKYCKDCKGKRPLYNK